MQRILIVEDTPAEADALRACLRRYEDECGAQFSVEVVSSALDFVERRPRADLIFMDIDMPGINGMEAAELLRTCYALSSEPVTRAPFIKAIIH